jgi:hypothetical protein
MSTHATECNVCGGGETDHHLVVEIERVFGASVWIYDDEYIRIVPHVTRRLVQERTVGLI